jgi:uracil-DNA glycosylase
LLPAGSAADARQQALLRAAVACLPAALQRAPWLEIDAAVPPPRARAYLAFGQEALQALGRALSATEQQNACVIGIETPALMLAEPARKRSLWHALKTLRRALEEAD